MFAWYPPYNTSLKLGQDDIQVIKYLYGKYTIICIIENGKMHQSTTQCHQL